MNNVEMLNLMCIFNHSSKAALIADIRESLPYIDDSNMANLMRDTLETLVSMTEEEYAEIVFEPAIDDEEEWDA